MYKIAVVGAGVIGLTTAVTVQEKLGSAAAVTIFTENVSPNTTGDVSAGLWTPYLMQDTNPEDIVKWSKSTANYFEMLWRNGYAEEAGISLVPVIKLTCEENFEIPNWCSVPFGCTKLSQDYLDVLNKRHRENYTAGFLYVTFTCEPTKFLPFLEKIFTKNGGSLIRRKISNLEELAKFDVIVNCTGLQAKELVNDNLVKPIRGQITRVEAPWQFHCFMADDNYIIPNIQYIILGGTKQEGDYNLEVVEKDKQSILNGCFNMVPPLKFAPVYKHMVGLRPSRSKVRLELEKRFATNGILNIVHNYGHGGCGVTLCIGCAADATELVQVAINRMKNKL